MTTWEKAEVEINGETYDAVGVDYASNSKLADLQGGFDGVRKSFTEFTTSITLVDDEMRRFINACTPPIRGVTLAKRVFYGGRKGRRAYRRLKAMGLPYVLHIGPQPDGTFAHAALARAPRFVWSGR